MEGLPGALWETGEPQKAHRKPLRGQADRERERVQMRRGGAKEAALWFRAVCLRAG